MCCRTTRKDIAGHVLGLRMQAGSVPRGWVTYSIQSERGVDAESITRCAGAAGRLQGRAGPIVGRLC